ncbi:MAG TPA: F0F1 ATP synthase subunit A [Gemmataceae bacterium]|nr:F0F1 ATP synthase subunit A [Gemmataceae bacterium]
MAEHKHDPLKHVQDTDIWEFFSALFGDKQELRLPAFDIPVFNYHFQITKFMILELIAAALILLIYLPLARRAKNGELPKGRWWNAFESLLTFVRNEIAKPNLGDKDADKYVPYLWTLFLFLLFCNLLGMFPFMGSPTASIWATGGLALISFVMLHGAAIVKMGYEPPGAHGHDHHEAPGHHLETGHHDHAHSDAGLRNIPILGPLLIGTARYFRALWPRIDVPYVGWFFSLVIFVIELIGTVIKSGVLAVRLFANMFAGHMVLAVILLFIVAAAESRNYWLLGGISIAGVFGVAALSLLELFVAFLQAYIFVFLTALFMGMSMHPEH